MFEDIKLWDYTTPKRFEHNFYERGQSATPHNPGSQYGMQYGTIPYGASWAVVVVSLLIHYGSIGVPYHTID